MTWRWMALSGVLTLWLCSQSCKAFSTPVRSRAFTSTSLFAMNRKARRQQKKSQQQEVRNKRLREVLVDDDDSDTAAATDDPVFIGDDKDDDEVKKPPAVADSVTGGASSIGDRVAEEKEERPEVSRIVTDEETGIEIIEQGQRVMDVVTRKAVKLSDLGPMYRLAQMFPGVPPDVREKLRFNWETIEADEIIDLLREACTVKLEDGSRGLPKAPSVANKAIDFVLANRDWLGHNMERTLVRLMLRSQSLGEKDAARGYRDLAKHFFLLENHISAPFRQMILDGEERIGPNFGNLDLRSFCGKEVYERCADYLVLKGMVAHWAQKYRDGEKLESLGPETRDNFLEIVGTGDPKRFLPQNQIIWEKKDCEQILAMALKMTSQFVETPELFDDLPVEIRFLEKASTIQDGTALRKFVEQDFCPAEQIEPAGLREGMRRLLQQLNNMQVDPYEDIWFVVDRCCEAMEQGTPEENNPYAPILLGEEGGPGYFQTYTFESVKQSIIRFLDRRLEQDENSVGAEDVEYFAKRVEEALNFGNIFGKPEKAKEEMSPKSEDQEDTYKVPEERAIGRPHNLGWLDDIKDPREPGQKVEPMPVGRIIFEE